MRKRFLKFGIGLFLSLCLPAAWTGFCCAQYTYDTLERIGLQQNWSTMVEADPTLDGIAGISISVNHDDEQAFTIHEVDYDGGSKRFSQFDVGPNGLPLGPAEALRLAEVEVLRKKALGRNPVLNTKKVKPVDLFVTTSAGVLQSINAETGRTNWAISIGSPKRPTSAPTANDWFVAAVNGSTLYVVRRDTGEPVFDRELQNSPMVGPEHVALGPTMTNYGFETIDDVTVSKDWIYVPCTRGRLEAYKVGDSRAPAWFTTARGEIVGSPVIGAGLVTWTTSSGYLMVAGALDQEMRFRLQTGAQIDSSPAYLSPGRFYVAARDGYLYAVDKTIENTVWEFSAAQPILAQPIGIGDDVFTTTLDMDMYCVSASDGTQKWMAPAIHTFVAASESNVYALDSLRRLVVLNRATGVRVGSSIRVNARPIVNTQTDRIYVASKLGNLYCFGELGTEFPAIYHPKEILEEDKPLGTAKPDTPAAETPTDPDLQAPADTTELPTFDDGPTTEEDDNPFDFGVDPLSPDESTEPATDEPAADDFDFDMGDDENPFDFGDN